MATGYSDGRKTTDLILVGKIADRAVELYAGFGIKIERLTVLLDVLTVHDKVQRLRLDSLLATDDANFAHDISGINHHLDRDRYALTQGFRPRFSQPSAAA